MILEYEVLDPERIDALTHASNIFMVYNPEATVDHPVTLQLVDLLQEGGARSSILRFTREEARGLAQALIDVCDLTEDVSK